MEVETYAPVGVLKPLAEDVWIVDGPVIHMRLLPGLSLPFPTRMTVLRLDDGALLLHSPVEADPGLVAAVGELGEVRWLLAPNRLHWWWLGDWAISFPDAEAIAAPGVAEAVARGAGFGRGPGPERPPKIDRVLSDRPEPAWRGALEHLLVRSRFMAEAVLFHRRSATLVLTDLIENFEPRKVRGAFARVLIRLGGVVAPHGATPRDLRLNFSRAQRRAFAASRDRMIAWRPARIVLAHGRIIEEGAAARLASAFAWAGPA